jgi:hypothetical protein
MLLVGVVRKRQFSNHSAASKQSGPNPMPRRAAGLTPQLSYVLASGRQLPHGNSEAQLSWALIPDAPLYVTESIEMV